MGRMENPWGKEPDWARRTNNNNNFNNNEDDDDDYDYYDDPSSFAAQHILVLIDCNPTMFVPTLPYPSPSTQQEEEDSEEEEEEEQRWKMTPIDIALQAVEKLLRLRVNYVATSKRGRSRDGTGVLLYGCQHKHTTTNTTQNEADDSETDDGEEEEENVPMPSQSEVLLSSTYELISLSPPGTEQVLSIMDCLPSLQQRQQRKCHREGYSSYSQSVSGAFERKRNLHYEFTSSSSMSTSMLCTLRSALHEACKIFANAKCVKKNATASSSTKKSTYNLQDSKSIWIFTNNDNPCHNPNYHNTTMYTQEEEEREQVLTVAKDAMENGIDIKIWPLPRCYSDEGYNDDDDDYSIGSGGGGDGRKISGEQNNNLISSSFDWNLFYNDFYSNDSNHDHGYTNEEDDEESERTTISKKKQKSSSITNFDLEEMMEDIKIHWKKVRKAFSLPLLLPGWRWSREKQKHVDDDDSGIGIMMDFFRVVTIQRRPQPVTVHQATNKMTVRSTQAIALETGEIVPPERIQTYIEFGGEHIPISHNEVSMIKRQSNANDKFASLSLIGFQPLSDLPSNHMTMDDKCYIVYPNEDMVKGSKKAFDSLYASTVRKKVFAVGELLTRVTSMCRLVAMVPQMEGGENGDVPTSPPGFLVFQLPYEDDVRAVGDDNNCGDCDDTFIADETTIEAAMKVIQKQKMGGIEFGYSFENPALKNFWNYIESVALGLPLSNSIKNDSDDEEEEIDDTTMDVDGILKCAGKEIEDFKMCLPEEEEEEKGRKPRKRKVVVVKDDSEIDWVHAFDTNTLSEYSVEILKKYLRSVGAKVSGRKADLVERVEDCIKEGLGKNKDEQLEMSDSFGKRVCIKEEEEV